MDLYELLSRRAGKAPRKTVTALKADNIFSAFPYVRTWMFLQVQRPETFSAVVQLKPATMVSDIPKFVEGMINDLMVFLESRNAGRRHHWMDLLIDEKVEQLKLCGVTVEIRALESADRVH